MKRLAWLVLLALLPACSTVATTVLPGPTPSPTTVGISSIAVPPAGSCHARNDTSVTTVLQDPSCTPGSLNPAVTQATIKTTICQSGYTATIRPPVSVTDPLKLRLMASYSYHDSPSRYELDHLISLELGGAPLDAKNLWPELGSSPNPKDKVENTLHSMVCSGKIALADAQHRISTDWTTALA